MKLKMHSEILTIAKVFTTHVAMEPQKVSIEFLLSGEVLAADFA